MTAKAERVHPFHFRTNDPDLDRLLKPSTAYRSPDDVVNDRALTLAEKKAILASWASDACAVESRPAFRQPAELSHPISFDDIMAALQEVDRLQSETETFPSGGGSRRYRSHVC
jgi:hypothetical protein